MNSPHFSHCYWKWTKKFPPKICIQLLVLMEISPFSRTYSAASQVAMHLIRMSSLTLYTNCWNIICLKAMAMILINPFPFAQRVLISSCFDFSNGASKLAQSCKNRGELFRCLHWISAADEQNYNFYWSSNCCNFSNASFAHTLYLLPFLQHLLVHKNCGSTWAIALQFGFNFSSNRECPFRFSLYYTKI